jgi:hypothetical protein
MINHIEALRFLTFVRNDVFPHYDEVSKAGIQRYEVIETAFMSFPRKRESRIIKLLKLRKLTTKGMWPESR